MRRDRRGRAGRGDRDRLVFDFTNGFHDSANSVAALVATRAPGAALLLAAVCHVAGPLLAGATVADTVGGVGCPPAPRTRWSAAWSGRASCTRHCWSSRRNAVRCWWRCGRRFSTPIESEDVFELAERLGEIADAAYMLVRESDCPALRPTTT